MQWAQSATKVLSGMFEVLGENLTQAADMPSLLNDPNWRQGTLLFMKTIKETDAEIITRKPPKLFADVHADFASAASHYNKSMDFLAAALDKRDASKLSQALQEMKTGNDLITRATEKIKIINVP